MLAQIVSLLFGTAANLLTLALIARVWMQWTRASFRNPVGEFVIAFTNWAVLPLRRAVPGLFGIDMASLVAAWLIQLAFLALMASLTGPGLIGPGGLLVLAWVAVINLIRHLIYLLIGAILVAALLSWISPRAPAASVFNDLAHPVLAPVRRFLPVFGGIDLSPLVAILLLQAVLIVLGNAH